MSFVNPNNLHRISLSYKNKGVPNTTWASVIQKCDGKDTYSHLTLHLDKLSYYNYASMIERKTYLCH